MIVEPRRVRDLPSCVECGRDGWALCIGPDRLQWLCRACVRWHRQPSGRGPCWQCGADALLEPLRLTGSEVSVTIALCRACHRSGQDFSSALAIGLCGWWLEEASCG